MLKRCRSCSKEKLILYKFKTIKFCSPKLGQMTRQLRQLTGIAVSINCQICGSDHVCISKISVYAQGPCNYLCDFYRNFVRMVITGLVLRVMVAGPRPCRNCRAIVVQEVLLVLRDITRALLFQHRLQGALA